MRRLRIVVWLLGTLSVLACAERAIPMKGTEVAPAARAQIDVEANENGNNQLQIEALHLAPASRVRADATVYVVWVAPLDGSGDAQNVGAMQVDADLRATLRTVTPLEDFNVFVTAEPSGNARIPSGPKVLWASVR